MALAAVSAVPWALPIDGIVGDVAAGSRAVFVVVLPILVWILLAAFAPPSGVVDHEVNWIVALLGCAAAVVVIVLSADRIPTLTRLWRIDLVGPIIWTAAATTILLGVRYAVRLWDVWLLLVFASPFPFLMLTALAGGSDLAVAAVACCLAAVVVARSARASPPIRIAAGTATSLVLGLATACLFLAAPAPRGIGLIVAVVLGAGLIPLGVSYAVRPRVPRTAPDADRSTFKLPATSRRGAIALAALAAATAVLCAAPRAVSPAPLAAGNWTERSNLIPVSHFHAAAALLGPHATFTRYRPEQPSSPVAAVDVITAPTRGILEDVSDAQWYPSDEPVDFRPADLADIGSVIIRSAHSNADNDVDPDTPHWYLLTWIWRVKAGFQQVNVVVSQRKDAELPLPSELSTADLLVDPAMWVARQQPRRVSEVDIRTVEVARELARRLIVAADVDHRSHVNG